MAIKVIAGAKQRQDRRVGAKAQPARQRSRNPGRHPRVSKSYLALVRAYPIHPIRSEPDLDEAIAVLDSLQSRPAPLDSQEQDYLDCLAHEIERYEAEAHPMPAVSGAEMLRHLMDAHETNLSEVAHQTGIALSTLSAVLNQKRKLNLAHIKALAACFGVEPAVFVG